MKPFLIVVFALVIVAVVVIMFFKNKKNKTTSDVIEGNNGLAIKKTTNLSEQGKYEMTIKFDDLPALTELEESHLVEVKDSKLLAKIDSAVPGTLQAVANTGAVKQYADSAKAAE